MNDKDKTPAPVDIEELLQKTDNENDLIKRQALKDLNKILPTLAARRACDLLEDPDYIVRKAAIDILLSQVSCVIHLKRVRPLLHDVHYVPRFGALEFILKVAPEEAISHAENMLDDDYLVSSLAITIIAEQDNSKAHETLLKYAKHSNSLIRIHCLDLIAHYNVADSKPLLKKALSDPDEYVRMRASEMDVKTSCKNSEGCEASLTFDKILSNINEQDPDFAIKYALEKLNDQDHTIRFTAMQFLNTKSDRSNPEHILPLLTDPHHTIRNIALQYTKEADADAAIARARAGVDNSFEFITQALETIASRQKENSLKTLFEFLKNDDRRVRGQCLYLLAEFYPSEAEPFLEKALNDPNGYIRSCASNAIEMVEIWHQEDTPPKKWY